MNVREPGTRSLHLIFSENIPGPPGPFWFFGSREDGCLCSWFPVKAGQTIFSSILYLKGPLTNINEIKKVGKSMKLSYSEKGDVEYMKLLSEGDR